MKWISSMGGLLLGVAVLALVARFLGLDDFVHAVVASGHLPDVIMGALCLVWLLLILKAPWDLYFQASAVAFDQERSAESRIPLASGRIEYVLRLRRRLGLLAVGAHIASAILIAAVAYFTGDRAVGYWFAVFYLVSTAFRPAVAGYVYLSRKLTAVGQEVRYPREDVAEMRGRLVALEQSLRAVQAGVDGVRTAVSFESEARAVETRELRERQAALAREFETTASRLTDNQEVIRGIQSFVRLITQSTRAAEG